MDDTAMHQPAKATAALGRYPCGEETRQRIIDSAVDIFGRQGFVGTSTRDIAVAAGIKTPAIQYYFGSKLGLYDACIDQLTATAARRIRPEIDRCQATISAGASADMIVAAVCRVQDSLIDSFFDDYEGHAIQRLLAWEDVQETLSASEELLKERIGRPIFNVFREAVASLMATPLHIAEIEIQAAALMSTSLIFHTNRNRVLDLIRQPDFNDDVLRTLKQVARRQVSLVLLGLPK